MFIFTMTKLIRLSGFRKGNNETVPAHISMEHLELEDTSFRA